MKTLLQDYLTLKKSVEANCTQAYSLRRSIEEQLPRLETAWRNVLPTTFARQLEYAWNNPDETAKIVATRNKNLITLVGAWLTIRHDQQALSHTHAALSHAINEADQRLEGIESRSLQHDDDMRILLKLLILESRGGFVNQPSTHELFAKIDKQLQEAFALTKASFAQFAAALKHRVERSADGLNVSHSLDYLYPKGESALAVSFIGLPSNVVSHLPACDRLVTAIGALKAQAHALEKVQFDHERLFRYMTDERGHADDLLAAATNPARRTRSSDFTAFGRVDLIEDQNKKRVRQLAARQLLLVTVAAAEESRVDVRNALVAAVTETEALLKWIEQSRSRGTKTEDLAPAADGTSQALVQKAYLQMLTDFKREDLEILSAASIQATTMCLSADRVLRRHEAIHRKAYTMAKEELTSGAVWAAVEAQLNP
ncbi:hypothetical protein BH10CYA1_BH10CYA1_41870 [soil metagenome]